MARRHQGKERIDGQERHVFWQKQSLLWTMSGYEWLLYNRLLRNGSHARVAGELRLHDTSSLI